MLHSSPQTAAEVTFYVHESTDFASSLHQWQTALQEISSRKELLQRIKDAPPLLRSRLKDKGYCDAYLAAYVEWVCQFAKINPPDWVTQPNRIADAPFADEAIDLSQTPNAFRRRNLFTIPKNVLQLRRGRPKKSEAHKLKNNAERQRRYRQRVKEKLQRLEALEREMNAETKSR